MAHAIWQNRNTEQKVVSTHTQNLDGSWRLHFLDLDPLNADEVRGFRKSQNLKQDELADLCAVTVDAVRKWESGTVKIPAFWRMVFASIAANLAPYPYPLPDYAEVRIKSPNSAT